MRNLRTYIISRYDLEHNEHINITDTLKRAGFKFDREGCPTKITQPWAVVENDINNTIIWSQWDLSPVGENDA